MITVTPRALSSASAASKRRFAGRIEIRVRLVEHDQARIAVQRARQRDALTLAAGQHCAAVADLRVVAVRQLQDHFVRVREPRRANDPLRGLGAGRCAEARDVLADRAGEQLDVLRQIADVLAERIAIPARRIGAVEPHAARLRPPQTEQQANQSRLAGRAGADDAEAFAGREREAHVPEQRRARRQRTRTHSRSTSMRPVGAGSATLGSRRHVAHCARRAAAMRRVRRPARASRRSDARPAAARAKAESSRRS